MATPSKLPDNDKQSYSDDEIELEKEYAKHHSADFSLHPFLTANVEQQPWEASREEERGLGKLMASLTKR